MTTSSQPQFDCDFDLIVPLLLAAKGIKEGLWHVGVKMRFAGVNGAFTDADGLNPSVLPTALVGFEGLVLTPAPMPGPLVFDAATGKETGAIVRPIPQPPFPAVKMPKPKRAPKA